MDIQWDRIEHKREFTIRGMGSFSLLCFLLGVVFVVLSKQYPNGYNMYVTFAVISFFVSVCLFIVGSVLLSITAENLTKNPVDNAAVSRDTEMRPVPTVPPLDAWRQETEERPNVRSRLGRYSRIGSVLSSYFRYRLMVTGIPRGSDREPGNWEELDTPEPDSNLRRPEDIEEEPESDNEPPVNELRKNIARRQALSEELRRQRTRSPVHKRY